MKKKLPPISVLNKSIDSGKIAKLEGKIVDK